MFGSGAEERDGVWTCEGRRGTLLYGEVRREEEETEERQEEEEEVHVRLLRSNFSSQRRPAATPSGRLLPLRQLPRF